SMLALKVYTKRRHRSADSMHGSVWLRSIPIYAYVRMGTPRPHDGYFPTGFAGVCHGVCAQNSGVSESHEVVLDCIGEDLESGLSLPASRQSAGVFSLGQ